MGEPRRLLIYLTGFMGSGKSTIAPILAHALGYRLLDIDHEIEVLTGKIVNEIFSEMGEPYFRNVEQSVLRNISKQEGCVVSLGGGTVVDDLNLRIIKSSGILVYLRVAPKELFQRLKFKTDRPLLQSAQDVQLTDEEFRKRIESLLSVREPFYNQADITVDGGNRDAGIVDEIVRRLKTV